MHVTIDTKIVYGLLDTLLARWTASPKKFPYNKRDAVIPQTTIPEEIRKDPKTLACFYFYTCIYMRGGIESLQAFTALIKLWREDPNLFDPSHAQWLTPEYMEEILRSYIGWDAKSASKSWVENSRRLMQSWKGNPLMLAKGLRSYDEALRRMRNKLTKRDQKTAGSDGHGFRGFQPKMVSMLLYFFDWSGLLEKRFLYPAPADFHNFRLGFATGGIILPFEADQITINEHISKAWRTVLMDYMREKDADPIEVADAIWMFSLVLCGNSPLTATREAKLNGSGMFKPEEVKHDFGVGFYLAPRFRKPLQETCLRCPIVTQCTLAIPSRPYYRKGKLVFRERLRMERHLGIINPDTPIRVHKKKKDIATVPQFWEPAT